MFVGAYWSGLVEKGWLRGGFLNEGNLGYHICVEVLWLTGEITLNNLLIRPMFSSMSPNLALRDAYGSKIAWSTRSPTRIPNFLADPPGNSRTARTGPIEPI